MIRPQMKPKKIDVSYLFPLVLLACNSDPAGAGDAGVSASGSATTLVAPGPTPTIVPPSASGPEPPPPGSIAATGSATGSASGKASATPSPSAKPPPSAVASASGTPHVHGTSLPSAIASALAPPPAKKGSADEVAENIDAIFQPKKIIQAKFKQKFTVKAQGTEKDSSGTILVEKPGKLSMRYDAPSKNRVVSDGKEIKVYVADENVMYVSTVKGKEIPGAMSFMMGSGLRNNFDFTFNDKPAAKQAWPSGPTLWGKPRSPTPHYDYVLFYVEQTLLDKKDPALMRRVLIVDTQGNKNRFDFSELTHPATVDAKEFTFDPPKGTDIKRQ